ncbi:hypothetical protein ABZ499_16460 [Streptomyces sp. NPDC019990]|uniref:hypothetical protein n=1 Tax=Streptomyces sp. NPDC019990 TaxID=3154693 RepID=UPI0033DB6955
MTALLSRTRARRSAANSPRGRTWKRLYTGALSSVSDLIVLLGSSATGSLLDLGLPTAVPWLLLAAVPALAVALLPRRPSG